MDSIHSVNASEVSNSDETSAVELLYGRQARSFQPAVVLMPCSSSRVVEGNGDTIKKQRIEKDRRYRENKKKKETEKQEYLDSVILENKKLKSTVRNLEAEIQSLTSQPGTSSELEIVEFDNDAKNRAVSDPMSKLVEVLQKENEALKWTIKNQDMQIIALTEKLIRDQH